MGLHGLLRRMRRRRRCAVSDPSLRPVLEEFEKHVGYRFSDSTLLCWALTHRSYLNSNGVELPGSNERLEFLGDSVLELVVNEFLYHRYPDHQEGELTKMKSLLVSRGVLAEQAKLPENPPPSLEFTEQFRRRRRARAECQIELDDPFLDGHRGKARGDYSVKSTATTPEQIVLTSATTS